MTLFDYLVLGIVGISLLMGVLRGVVGELIALGAWILAAWTALHFGPQVGGELFQGIADPSLRTLAGCALLFVAVLVTMALVRMAVKRLVQALGLGVSDRILGALFGLARGTLIAMVLVAIGGMTAAPQQPWWQEARFSAPLETAVLMTRPWLPDDVAKRIRFS